MVLVSIVGDFDSSILPIIYEYKKKLSKHILLYDDFNRDVSRAKNIKRGIKKFKKSYGYSFETLEYRVDEDSLEALKECASFLLTQAPSPQKLFINTTDGFSTLTTILNQALFAKGVNFIAYDRYDNEYNLLNKNKLQKFSIQKSMKIEEHFILKGYGVQRSDVAEFAKKYKKEIKKLFEVQTREYDTFIKYPNTNKSIKELPKEYNAVKKLFVSMGLAEFKIKDPIVTGTLFEAYVFNLLEKLEYDDIAVGLKIYRNYKNSKIENEFDILIMKNNHLHMLECKYKNQLKLEELIYKYIALSEVIDDDAQMILVSKKEPAYSSKIDMDIEGGKIYKRGILSNIKVLGAVAQKPQKFQFQVKNILRLP